MLELKMSFQRVSSGLALAALLLFGCSAQSASPPVGTMPSSYSVDAGAASFLSRSKDPSTTRNSARYPSLWVAGKNFVANYDPGKSVKRHRIAVEQPHALTVDPLGDLYVASLYSTITQYAADGMTVLRTITDGIDYPVAILLDSPEISMLRTHRRRRTAAPSRCIPPAPQAPRTRLQTEYPTLTPSLSTRTRIFMFPIRMVSSRSMVQEPARYCERLLRASVPQYRSPSIRQETFT